MITTEAVKIRFSVRVGRVTGCSLWLVARIAAPRKRR